PGYTVPDMLEADLKLEYHVREALARGIALCEQHGDYGSRDILVTQLKDTEEDHAYWLEKQLGLIKLIGLENYLQGQICRPGRRPIPGRGGCLALTAGAGPATPAWSCPRR